MNKDLMGGVVAYSEIALENHLKRPEQMREKRSWIECWKAWDPRVSKETFEAHLKM